MGNYHNWNPFKGLADFGNRLTGKDDYTQSIVALNVSQADYLGSLAQKDKIEADSTLNEDKESNKFLIVATVGTLLVAGAITYFVIRKK